MLKAAAVVGLDCEWKPRLEPGEKSSPAQLLQAHPCAGALTLPLQIDMPTNCSSGQLTG